MIKDRSGFVWIGTQDGLNRFDGTEFKNFRKNPSDSTSISGNYINTVAEDATGNIWIGTHGNGVSLYDRERQVFRQVALPRSSAQNEMISAITLDNQGSIWIASRTSGLHKLAPLKDTNQQLHGLSDYSISALSTVSQRGALWVGSEDGNVFMLDTKQDKIDNVRPEFAINGEVTSFYETKTHLLVGGIYGLYLYDLNNKTVEFLEFENEESKPTRLVTSFLKASEHRVWVGTGNGLYLFDCQDKVAVGKIDHAAGSNGLSNNTVVSLLPLSDNQLLVGTAKYLNLLDFSTPIFGNISKDQNGKHLLNDNVIFSILKERNNLWVGTSRGGLNLIQGEKVFYFSDDFKVGNIFSGTVRAMAKDEKNQRLWLATTRGLGMINLAEFDPENPVFSVFHHDPSNDNSINHDLILDIVLNSDQSVWCATYGAGVFRLVLDSAGRETIDQIKHREGNTNSLISDLAHCITTDEKGNIWVGTEGGVSKIGLINGKIKSTQFTHFTKNTEEGASLSHNSTYDILVDDQSRVWVGTQHGLNLIEDEQTVRSWIEQKQFPNAVVYSIQDDESGNLWIGTNDGLIQFSPENEAFTRYGVEDGIQNKEFDIHAKYRDTQGIIYLGGIGGVTYFQPQDLVKIDQPVPIYFSQLQIKDQLIATPNKDKLEIESEEFPFYLKFSTIDYRLNRNVSFAYKFEQAGAEWNPLKDAEIQFLNLPSGHYTLLVIGVSRGKVWSQPPLKMELYILPPWWGTWWAYVLYALVAGLIFFWFYRFQLAKKLAIAESKRLTEVNKLKSSLYTNITHEFRTPLTIILGMAEALKTNGKNNDTQVKSKSLELIERNGNKLLHLVNEMLDLAKLESGNMELQQITADVVPFVKYLCESFQSLAQESDINLVVYAEVDELIMDFDSQKLSTIVSNVVSNAIKFTPRGGKIIVHLNRVLTNNKPFFFIKVKDSGIGIAEDEVSHIFNRFYQVENVSRSTGGTGIGLALTKELVRLMGGTIHVNSELGEGSEFTIELPVIKTSSNVVEINSNAAPHVYTQEGKEGESLTVTDDADLPMALIIEDSTDVAYYLKVCLQGRYRSLHAENGEVGMKMAFEHIPDVVISDVMMPVKDGFEVCSILKSDERTDHIPIIMLTAKVTEKDRLTGLSKGADAYLPKPFSTAELHIRLDQLTQLRKKLIGKLTNDGFSNFLKHKVEDPETKFLQKAITIIHAEMDNDIFGPQLLARKLQLSESQLYRKLKATSDKSTAVFIRSVRLQKAKELLQTSNKTISEIAYEVGFNDPSWFSRAFKEEFGFAPSSIYK